ncbi:uncharacterized protein G2W53_033960 [Senna tora]|uniref:Uncharacterized protein n=1 Tax=Senna tora TaxID=362788 RepID=A0A834TAA4_9FABA|nr:uncharacterized protein G2W53_033960 [Senna tora]
MEELPHLIREKGEKKAREGGK